MTYESGTITPAGQVGSDASVVPGVGSVTETGAGFVPCITTTDRAGRLSPASAECLAAIRAHGNSPAAERMLALTPKAFANRLHELRAKGVIGPDEYRRKVTVSPINRKVQAARDARPHVIADIPGNPHFSRKGHVLSSLRCSCGVRLRSCDRDRYRGHATLAEMWSDHKNGPSLRGIGPRKNGRLVAEASMA